MRKTIITLFTICLLNINLDAQDCKNLPADQADLCYVKKFMTNSPIHDSLDESYFIYNIGTDYYPTGKYVPWGGYYMPLINGGIATRWTISNTAHPTTSNLYTWEQIQQMSINDIAKLSPAEKMDIYIGNRDFKITKKELENRGPERLIIKESTVNGVVKKDTTRVEGWEGFCNGIRFAGTILPEPEKSILVKSNDANSNVFILFYPADLKALAGASCFFPQWYASLGENNNRKPDAGLFDVLLREVLGKQKRTFFVDVNQSVQKWNESVVGYKREIIKETNVTRSTGLPQNTRKIVDVKVTLFLMGELELSNTPTRSGIADKTLTTPWTTEYHLYVDKDNKIISGKWEKFDNQTYSRFLDYPDYVWFAGGIGVDNFPIYSTQGGNVFLSFLEVQNLIMLSYRQ